MGLPGWAQVGAPALATPTAQVAATVGLPAPSRDALQAAGIPPGAVSLLVLPLGPGGVAAPRVSHLADQSRPVASVMKLFTTGAALLSRGPASTWHTDAGLAGRLDARGHLQGDLVLRGNGDPALVTEQLTQMMVRWQAAGLRHIDGDVVIDRSAFDVPPHDPAAFDGEALKPYNAGPDALLVNQQAVTLRLAPSAVQEGRWTASLEPALAGVTLVNGLKASATSPSKGCPDCCGDWREALRIDMTPAPATQPAVNGLRPWVLQLSGSLPLSCGARDWPLLWQGDGAGDHAARVALSTWQGLGGSLQGRVRQGRWPADLAVWQSWTSPPLAQVVRDINKFSNNVMARQLLLSLGTDTGGAAVPLSATTATTATTATAAAPTPVTLPQAREALQALVVQLTRDGQGRSPCTPPAWQVDNGSGLSRDERSSAACLGRWLQVLWGSPVMPEWLASLPLVGVDGTTRRWTGPAAGRAHIKTGSLDGVATMAGVVDGASGQRWAVVAMGQHPQAGALRTWYAQVLGWVAQQ
jgi:D-alanyl-D-alanine carboxypeptidase/D-alanyl-D-alanine-endopeptidase (penicillin-binding protein 4)